MNGMRVQEDVIRLPEPALPVATVDAQEIGTSWTSSGKNVRGFPKERGDNPVEAAPGLPLRSVAPRGPMLLGDAAPYRSSMALGVRERDGGLG